MDTLVFGVIALGVLAVATLALRVFMPPRHPTSAGEVSEHVSMTPLHRHAWWSLVVGLAVALVMVAVITIKGPTSFDESTSARLSVTALFVVALVTYAVTLVVLLRNADERDREIINRAPAVQLVASVVTVAIWSIVLTEAYSDEGSIPIVFPNLIFWSTFIVSVLARSVGVLLGYAGWNGISAEWL